MSAEKHDDKKGPIATMWKWVFIAIGVLLGVIVLIMFGGVLLRMSVDSFNGEVHGILWSFTALGNTIGQDIPQMLMAWSNALAKLIMGLIRLLILPVIAFLIGRMIYNEIKKGGAKPKVDPKPAAAKPAADKPADKPAAAKPAAAKPADKPADTPAAGGDAHH